MNTKIRNCDSIGGHPLPSYWCLVADIGGINPQSFGYQFFWVQLFLSYGLGPHWMLSQILYFINKIYSCLHYSVGQFISQQQKLNIRSRSLISKHNLLYAR